jgi:hypothetical protein
MEAEKRATLLNDAQAALEMTQDALAQLDKGDTKAALAVLAQVTGKLDLVVARDPKLSLAPVSVTTSFFDLYATPDAVKADVKVAKDSLSNNQVQIARGLLRDMASEADIHVAELPLATYPAAIKAVVPLIDAGKIEEAKAALHAALHTMVIESFILPLPEIRAEAMLAAADSLAAKGGRSQEENTALHGLMEATRTEIQLAEALGYGSKADYKPLYSQLDDIEKKVEGGQSGRGLFDKMRRALKDFKFST